MSFSHNARVKDERPKTRDEKREKRKRERKWGQIDENDVGTCSEMITLSLHGCKGARVFVPFPVTLYPFKLLLSRGRIFKMKEETKKKRKETEREERKEGRKKEKLEKKRIRRKKN